MGEYVDFHANMQMFLRSLEERNSLSLSKEKTPKDRKTFQRVRRKRVFDPRIYQVRPCICVTGFNRSAIQRVKSILSSLSDQPLPLESFHVAKETDVKDGALLVPKVILVAVHCPGRKLIDDKGDEGQLDFLYDEVIEMGADFLVIFLELPKVIYPPARNYIYHPRVADLLFPEQPILQALAMDFGLITVTEKSDFNLIQKNLLREWMTKPVSVTHRIYRTAEYLSEYSMTDAEWWSENETQRGHPIQRGQLTSAGFHRGLPNRGFASATEEHPVVKRKAKKHRKTYGTARSEVELHRPLLSGLEDSNAYELELYNEAYSYHMDSLRLSEQV